MFDEPYDIKIFMFHIHFPQLLSIRSLTPKMVKTIFEHVSSNNSEVMTGILS